MPLLRSVAVVAALAALTSGCSSNDPTATPPPIASSTSTPVNPPASPTPTLDVDEFPEPVPLVPVSDGSAEKVFGDDLFAENTVSDLAAKWIGLTLANKKVVTGDITPAEALCTEHPTDSAKTSCSLPFEGAAQKVAIADPTSWTLVSFDDETAGRRGVGAELLDRDQMSVSYEAVKKDGIDQLRVTFTGRVRTTYTEQGTRFVLDGERDFELWLIPNTYGQGDPWRINGFRNSEVRWDNPVEAGE